MSMRPAAVVQQRGAEQLAAAVLRRHPLNTCGEVCVQLARQEPFLSAVCAVRAEALDGVRPQGIRLDALHRTWRRCVAALESNFTLGELTQ